MKTLGRFWRSNIKNFGVYCIVSPAQTTPLREVPNHIKRPNYGSLQETISPTVPEVKDVIQIDGMRESCKLAASILQKLHNFVQPGVTTDEIDKFVHRLTIESGAYPSPLKYNGYPKSVCTSVNNVIVHGIPDLRPLEDGDVVNVDVTVFFHGFHGDCSKNYLVGNVDDKGIELVKVSEECLNVGIEACGPGAPFTQIGYKIEEHAKKKKSNCDTFSSGAWNW